MPALKTDVSMAEAPHAWQEVLPIKFCLYINKHFGKVAYEGIAIRHNRSRTWTHYYVFFQAYETAIHPRVLIFSQCNDESKVWGVV